MRERERKRNRKSLWQFLEDSYAREKERRPKNTFATAVVFVSAAPRSIAAGYNMRIRIERDFPRDILAELSWGASGCNGLCVCTGHYS